MGVYRRYSRRGSVRRSSLASRFQPGSFPQADCTGCGVRLHYGFGATVPAVPVCESCEAAGMLRAAGRPVPTWASRLFVRDGDVLALCTGQHGPACPVDTLDPATGRCPFCALPGALVPGTDNRKVHGGVLFVREGNGFYAVQLDEAGRLPVNITDQNRGDMGPALVDVGSTPAWGTGWQVVNLGTGEWVWYMAHWDSSG